MKAHHFGATFFDHFTGRVIERRAIGYRRRCVEIHAEFAVVGFQQILPVPGTLLVGRGRLMAEEVDVDRALSVLANGLQFFAQLLGGQHGRGHRAQAAGIACGDDHGRTCSACHRSLDDRQFDPQQINDSGIWPLAHFKVLRVITGKGCRTGLRPIGFQDGAFLDWLKVGYGKR